MNVQIHTLCDPFILNYCFAHFHLAVFIILIWRREITSPYLLLMEKLCFVLFPHFMVNLCMQQCYYPCPGQSKVHGLCAKFLSVFDLHRKANADNHALSDASKKRLIEDTEDWHPKTGTSQSRSFRILAQLTGTENGPYRLRSPTTLSGMFIEKLWKELWKFVDDLITLWFSNHTLQLVAWRAFITAWFNLSFLSVRDSNGYIRRSRVLGYPPVLPSGKILPDWCGVSSRVSAAVDIWVASGPQSPTRGSITMTRCYRGKKAYVG